MSKVYWQNGVYCAAVKGMAVLLMVCAVMSPSLGMSAPPNPESQGHDRSQALDQMNWKLGDTDWVSGLPLQLNPWKDASPEELDQLIAETKRSGSGDNLHRTIEALMIEDDEESQQRAKEILEKLIAAHAVDNINEVITSHGIEYPGMGRHESGNRVHEATPASAQRPPVLNLRDLAHEYALHSLLTGDPDSAAKAKAILLRFAAEVPNWPLYGRDNLPHDQSDQAFLDHGNANGIWSIWAPKDLVESLPLLRAYDVLRPSFSEEEREKVEKDLFVHQVDLLSRMKMVTSVNNMAPYHLVPLARFGLVLQRPEFVHDAVNKWERILSYSFAPDGMWREITPAYHQQAADRLLGVFPPVLKGYSDPAGYVDPESGERFDDLDLSERQAVRAERIRAGLNVLAMPDGFLVSLNDDWPKGQRIPAGAAVGPDEPGLLGVSGVAKLGGDGMVAFLQFGGLRGHDHHDAMNLVWFAGGREVFGETGYQALPGSDSSRTWHTITAGHNTVAVDEETQFQNYKDFLVPDSSQCFAYTAAPPTDGLQYPVAAAFRGAANIFNQGRLLLWNPADSEAQAMEAEQERAYPGLTTLFRRTVVMVPMGEGDGYLVDIFRIVGGSTHDFFLRGGLDAPYTMKIDQALKPAKKTAYEFIDIKEEGTAQIPLTETTEYEDGYKVVSRLGDVLGSSEAKLKVMLGDAPAMRRLGRTPIAIIRRKADSASKKLESTYVWVHAAGAAGEKIKDVKVESSGTGVTVIVERSEGRDFVFSDRTDAGQFSQDGWKFSGRLAFGTLRERDGDKVATGVVFGGGELQHEAQTVALASPSLEGAVISTTNKDAGEDSDSLLVSLEGGELPSNFTPRLAHIDFGDVIRFSIPVKSAQKETDGWRLNLAHGPGFVVEKDQLRMTASPGWIIKGSASIRLDCDTAPAEGSSQLGD